MSPYLFLTCAEGFSSSLNQAARQGKITEMKIAKDSSSLSHLFSADDALIFCKANAQEAEYFMNIMDVYGVALGQAINKEKSSGFFSTNVDEEQRREVLLKLGGMTEAKQSKYLGLPLVIGRSKFQVFDYIREKTVKDWYNLIGNHIKTIPI